MKTIKRLINYIKYKRSANRIIKEVKRQILVDVKNRPASTTYEHHSFFIKNTYSLPAGSIFLSILNDREKCSSELKTRTDGSLYFSISIEMIDGNIDFMFKKLRGEFNNIIKKIMEVDKLNSIIQNSNTKDKVEEFMKKIKSDNQSLREFLELLFMTFKTEINNKIETIDKQIEMLNTKTPRESFQQFSNLSTAKYIRKMIQLKPINTKYLKEFDKSFFISEFNKEILNLYYNTNKIIDYRITYDVDDFFNYWIEVIKTIGFDIFYSHVFVKVKEKHKIPEQQILSIDYDDFYEYITGDSSCEKF